MSLNKEQRAICRELLQLSYDQGFGSAYPLDPIADKVGVAKRAALYDPNTETGLLWGLGPFGRGLLEIDQDGQWASVNFETRDMLEAWSREP